MKRSLKNRLDKLEEATASVPDADFSVLSDAELDFYIETLEKAGYDWNQEGNLSLLSDNEIQELERLTEKAQHHV